MILMLAAPLIWSWYVAWVARLIWLLPCCAQSRGINCFGSPSTLCDSGVRSFGTASVPVKQGDGSHVGGPGLSGTARLAHTRSVSFPEQYRCQGDNSNLNSHKV